MKECLVDVLNDRGTVLHVFSIPLEDENGISKAVNPEREALKLAALMQLAPGAEAHALHARPHVDRGGPLTPYADVLELRLQEFERAEQHIRERAYFLWLEEGCPENRADEHWFRACELECHAGSVAA